MDEAILEILFRKPAGPPIRIEEDFIEVSMDNLDFMSEDIGYHEPSIVVEEDMHPLDWDRLRDANDDYDSILIKPYGRL